MIHGSLFSGEGGFDLAAEWMGWENVFHCEINPFCQQILKYYWPKAKSYDDIKTTDFTVWRGLIDVLSGGFPCQPYSIAGKRLGKEDERHLWPEMLRAIREIQPRYVVGENVRGLINWNGGMVFDEVQSDLEAEGYEVIPFLLPAAGINAPHRRDRIWFVAHRNSAGLEAERAEQQAAGVEQHGKLGWSTADTRGFNSTISVQQRRQDKKANINTRWQDEGWITANANNITRWPGTRRENRSEVSNGNKLDATYTGSARWQEQHLSGISTEQGHGSGCDYEKPTDWRNFPTQPPVRSGNDGFPTELLRQRIREDCMGVISEKEIDKIISKAPTAWKNESIKAHGNAIVPQVVLQIFKAIEQTDGIQG